LLASLGNDRLSGHELAQRSAGQWATHASGSGQASGTEQASGSESYLYPTLHRLEADGRLLASWQPTSSGALRRVYRKSRTAA
jgi:hypothetical protein